MSTDATDVLDVLVVGGGVVGGTLACRLVDTVPGVRVGVVEPRPPRPLDDHRSVEEPDLRVFAITPASARILESGGVWQDVSDLRAPSFPCMQVWESVGSGYVRFGNEGGDALGFVAENRVLGSAVYDRLRALSMTSDSVHLMEGSGLTSLDLPAYSPVAGVRAAPAGLASAELNDGTTVRARLVVGADGGASRTRELAGVGAWVKDYEQRGLVATVRLAAPSRTAWQRFLPTGPLALLPLWGDLASIVWSTHPREARRLEGLDGDALARAVNEAFAEAAAADDGGAVDLLSRGAVKLSEAVKGAATTVTGADAFRLPPAVTGVIGSAGSFPLRMAGANEYARPRLALVGDAAHTVHPLAGQGLNLGIGDADALARTLARGAETGRDIGSLSLLREYDGMRRAQVQGMQTALDLIKAVFAAGGARPGLLSAVRTAGMASINALGPLKGEMAAFAMGSDSSAAAKVVASVGSVLGPGFGSALGNR